MLRVCLSFLVIVGLFSSPSRAANRDAATDWSTGYHSRKITDEEFKNKPWACHWWPKQDVALLPNRGSQRPCPSNNLYALNGPLDKLDKVTGKYSRHYEYDHHREPPNSVKGRFAGHMYEAAIASCILPEPQRDVTVRAQDGTSVKFTRNDISGLLVKIIPRLINHDDFSEPTPDLFLKAVNDLSKERLPFVLKITEQGLSWFFPCYGFEVHTSDRLPDGLAVKTEPHVVYCPLWSNTPWARQERVQLTRYIPFYSIKMRLVDATRHSYLIQFYREEYGGAVLQQGWYGESASILLPRAKGDIHDKSIWTASECSNNPEIDPEIVFNIYMES
ncbi:MAG TPA: hypothetical protein VEL47_01470, partial [Myxococcota bacterium]|nr:hypothetical protein [Myxococcota bacterium]